MELNQFCQSCSMPLHNDAMLGTEKDGSRNRQFCKYCYQDGSFVNPNMSLQEMTSFVKTKMQEMHIDQGIINKMVEILPSLNRWIAKSPIA